MGSSSSSFVCSGNAGVSSSLLLSPALAPPSVAAHAGQPAAAPAGAVNLAQRLASVAQLPVLQTAHQIAIAQLLQATKHIARLEQDLQDSRAEVGRKRTAMELERRAFEHNAVGTDAKRRSIPKRTSPEPRVAKQIADELLDYVKVSARVAIEQGGEAQRIFMTSYLEAAILLFIDELASFEQVMPRARAAKVLT